MIENESEDITTINSQDTNSGKTNNKSKSSINRDKSNSSTDRGNQSSSENKNTGEVQDFKSDENHHLVSMFMELEILKKKFVVRQAAGCIV